MKVVVVGSVRWRLGVWLKELGERIGNHSLACLGKRIQWG